MNQAANRSSEELYKTRTFHRQKGAGTKEVCMTKKQIGYLEVTFLIGDGRRLPDRLLN